MADGAGTSGRGRRAHRVGGNPIADSEAIHPAEPRSGRPTPAERAEAASLIKTMVALALLKSKSRAVEPAVVALALAWRRGDPSLDGLNASRRNTLFGLSPGAQTVRDWMDGSWSASMVTCLCTALVSTTVPPSSMWGQQQQGGSLWPSI